jgi:hypothetical protein
MGIATPLQFDVVCDGKERVAIKMSRLLQEMLHVAKSELGAQK